MVLQIKLLIDFDCENLNFVTDPNIIFLFL